MKKITESQLRNYITEIVKEYIEKYTTEDNWNNRPFKFINEGLIMSYAPKQLKEILERYIVKLNLNCNITFFPRNDNKHPITKQHVDIKNPLTTDDYSKLIEIQIHFKKGINSDEIDNINKLINISNTCGWMMSSIQDCYTLKEYKSINLVPIDSNKPQVIYLRPKFDQKVQENGIPNKCYHITPLRLLDKILKQGLHPKDFGRTSNHTERVYLFYNKPNNWKQIANLFKQSRKNEKYCLLEIDTSKLYNKIDFRFDSLTMTDNPAIYTFETIPPQYISIIDKE